jgi:glycine/D-amino acid oxidase-like deaminating enzyme
MDLKSGMPFSLIRHGLFYEYPALNDSLKTDVAIIGGGISGALMAYYLVRGGFECIVVDARTIGLGSTCASTSLLQYEIDVSLSELITKIGEKPAVRSYHLCREAIERLESICSEVGFNDFGARDSVYFAAKKKDVPFLQKEFAERKKHGFKVDFVEENALTKQFGIRSPAAIVSHHGANVDAYCLTHRLHQYGLRKGLQVFDRTKVDKTIRNKQGMVLKTDKGMSISARNVICATGYEVTEMIRKKIVKLQSTYATISESGVPISTGLQDSIFWNTDNPYFYMRVTGDNRIIVGGRDEKFYSPTRRDKLIAKKSKSLKKDFMKYFPSVPFKNEFSWTGTFGSTTDGLPFIGRYPNLPHTYFALGFGGNGITFSVVAARIVADLLKGRKNSDADLFRFDRI